MSLTEKATAAFTAVGDDVGNLKRALGSLFPPQITADHWRNNPNGSPYVGGLHPQLTVADGYVVSPADLATNIHILPHQFLKWTPGRAYRVTVLARAVGAASTRLDGLVSALTDNVTGAVSNIVTYLPELPADVLTHLTYDFIVPSSGYANITQFRIGVFVNGLQALGASPAIEVHSVQVEDVTALRAVEVAAKAQNFATRAAAAAAEIPADAQVITIGGSFFQKDAAGTAFTGKDGAKFKALGQLSPDAFGDATAALTAMQTAFNDGGSMVRIGKGVYVANGITYNIDHEAFVIKSSGIALNPYLAAQNNQLALLIDTPDVTPIANEHARVPISVTVRARGAQHGSGVRSNLHNYSTNGQGNTAFYGYTASFPGALWQASLHGEARHAAGTSIGVSIEMASFSMNGNMYGAVFSNTTASGHPTHPGGYSPVGHPYATAMLVTGTADNDSMGGWLYGLDFHPNGLRPSGTDIRIRTAAARHIHVEAGATASAADILLEANSANGIALKGTYSGSAISIPANQKFALDAAGVISMRYNSSNNRIEFMTGSTVRGYINMAAGVDVVMN